MLNPVVHTTFSVNLLGGILLKGGVHTSAGVKSLVGKMDTETSIYNGKSRFIQTKSIPENGVDRGTNDVTNIVMYVRLNIEGCIKTLLFNH